MDLCCCVGFSLVAASWDYSRSGLRAFRCCGFSYCGAWALGHSGFSSCDVWAQDLWPPGSGAQAQSLWHIGLIALWHVGSSWIRNQTRVYCTDRQILSHQGSPLFAFFYSSRPIPLPISVCYIYMNYWFIFERFYVYTGSCTHSLLNTELVACNTPVLHPEHINRYYIFEIVPYKVTLSFFKN